MYNMYPGSVASSTSSPGLPPCPTGEAFNFNQASPAGAQHQFEEGAEAGAGDNTYVLGMAMAGAMVNTYSPAASCPSPAQSSTAPVSVFPTSPTQMENMTVNLTNYNMVSPQQADKKKHWIEDELEQEKLDSKKTERGASRLEGVIKKEKEDVAWDREAVQEPTRRFKRGRLPINDKRMTPYELMKKERRREQNRRAARKCREKRKKQQDLVYEDYSRLQSENDMLRQQCDDYQMQLEDLINTLQQHELSCNLVLTGQMKPIMPYPPAPVSNVRARHQSSSSSTFDTSYSNYGGDCCYVENNCLETSVTPPMSSGQNMVDFNNAAPGADQMLSDEITDFVFEHNK